MMIYLLIFCGLILLGLFLRFIQPELIYSVRNALIRIKANKAFLDAQAQRRNRSYLFPRLLVQDFRYESLDYDEQYVLIRVMKIRELYRVLDLRRDSVNGLPKERKPQVCIIELANMLGNLGKHVSPEVRFKDHTIGANAILTFIGNEIRKSKNLPAFQDDAEVARWFTEFPITIEQTIEIMISAVFGLAYRQRSQSM